MNAAYFHWSTRHGHAAISAYLLMRTKCTFQTFWRQQRAFSSYSKLILNVTTEDYSTNYHVNFDKMTPAIYICRNNKREIIQNTLRIHKTGKKHKRNPKRSNVNEQIASFVLSIWSRLVCAVPHIAVHSNGVRVRCDSGCTVCEQMRLLLFINR